MSSPLPSLKAGFTRLKQSPQLWWTLFIAVIIFVAFVFIANLFVTIAQDAQDRLINVRVGSIHDTLAQYAYDVPTEDLNRIVANIADQNETIEEFKVVSVVSGENKILASIFPEEVGGTTQESNQLISFALSDPKNSYTTEILENNERHYITVRALQNKLGENVGYIETKQTLSEADRIINENIRRSIMIFILILAVVMTLFLRHAKIIDYIALYKKLKEVDQLKDDFISMASHELKSPMAVIRGYIEFLGEAKLDEKNKEYLRRIEVSSHQLVNLVEDMLDVSRIEQGRIKFDLDKFEIVSFLRERFADFDMQARDKKLDFTFEVTGGNYQDVFLDKDRLGQVFNNLLSNAIKYTKEGKVAVKVKIENNKNVEIRVSDTGIGMTQDEVENLFNKFYRVKTKDTEGVQGTGLGLWITKQLVEEMKGKISVESIKGKGTDFVVNFPIKQQK